MDFSYSIIVLIFTNAALLLLNVVLLSVVIQYRANLRGLELTARQIELSKREVDATKEAYQFNPDNYKTGQWRKRAYKPRKQQPTALLTAPKYKYDSKTVEMLFINDKGDRVKVAQHLNHWKS